jgi:hypothetical protein
MPDRVQLSRQKGWRMPENALKVDRSTRWGNPFSVGDRVHADPSLPVAVCFSRQQAVDAFRGFCEHRAGREFVAAIRENLRGKDLACWCPLDQPCHADVLLELANGDAE